MNLSNAPTLDVKEAEKAHAKAKSIFRLQKTTLDLVALFLELMNRETCEIFAVNRKSGKNLASNLILVCNYFQDFFQDSCKYSYISVTRVAKVFFATLGRAKFQF